MLDISTDCQSLRVRYSAGGAIVDTLILGNNIVG